ERERAALHPGPLARCEAWRQESIVDLARDGEAVELSCRGEEPVVRGPRVGEVFQIDLPRRQDAVTVDAAGVDARDLRFVGVEEALRKGHAGLERRHAPE